MRNRQVVIIGSHDDTGANLQTARRIGKHVALKGWVLITGGRKGVMEAASEGASDEGGTVVGIIPDSVFNTANPYCSVVIPTGIGYARNSINVLAADVVIAIGGLSGTLTEMSYAFQYGKPVICCMFAGGWSSLFAEFPEVRNSAGFHRAETLDDVFALLERLLG